MNRTFINTLAWGAGVVCLLTAPLASAKVRSNTQERLPDNVYKADIDGDGSVDFIEVNGSKIVVRRSDYEQTVILTDVLAQGNKIRQVFTGDFVPPGRRERGKDQLCAIFVDNSLSCWAISDDKKAMWWWFTQGSMVGANEHALVGEFTGDGVDDVLVYRPSDGNLRLFKPGAGGAFFDAAPFSLGNLTGINRVNKQIRVGEFGQALGRSDLLVFDPATRQVSRFDCVTNNGQPEFWWAFTTSGNAWSSSEDFTVANIGGAATDDVVFRNRTTGAYRFFKAVYNNGPLLPITNVQQGQLPTSPGGTVLFGKAARFSENGAALRDDAFYFSNGTLVRTDARWSGTAFTYWWAYTRSAPQYTRQQRTVYDVTAAQRQQLGNLLMTFITVPVVEEHLAGHDWHHPTNESFFFRHRSYINQAEKFLLNQGGSLFVPIPMWDPNTAIPTELRGFKPMTVGGVTTTPLRNVNPQRAMPTSLASPAVCSIGTATSLVQAVNSWHGGVHVTVGGTMFDAEVSPAAVIFWPWHAFVDNIYARWQDCR